MCSSSQCPVVTKERSLGPHATAPAQQTEPLGAPKTLLSVSSLDKPLLLCSSVNSADLTGFYEHLMIHAS